MQMTTILLATLPLVGVALGAILQHWLSRNAEDRNQLLAFRREAYVDFLRATTKIARAKDSDAAWDARTALADAKARIAIYGTTSVLHAMSVFEATGAAIRGDEGRRAFVLLTAAMREAESADSADLQLILLGPDANEGLPTPSSGSLRVHT
jgi:hypothetical protein